MSDFCKQCSEEKLGGDFKDLAGISTAEDTAKGLYAVVICEGCCGPEAASIQVDHEGRCVSSYCYEQHGDPNERL